jgi:dehydrogenase/reductase SDR family member 12
MMITLKESIQVNRPMESVFNYTSDFSNIQAWDPGVVSSKKKSSGVPRIGSRFDLILKFGPFRPRLQYVITEYIPFSKMVLHGRAHSFTAVDTICFVQTPAGTQIDYQADIQFSGVLNRLERVLAPVLKRTGKNAVKGLEEKLNQPVCWVQPSSWFSSGSNTIDYIADHTILPGMLMFSRLGYSISKRFWTRNTETLYAKKVVITGGTSGIGKAAAIKLAEKKAFLTLIARDKNKAMKVQQEIIARTGNPHVDFLLADLSLMTDIKRVAKRLIDKKKSIDILINNAGALFNERRETAEGMELTFATDLLGVFYLTQRLKKIFPRQGAARIINVSSGGMYTQKIDVHDLQNKQGAYDGSTAYARAKRGVVILTECWAEQMRASGVVVHSMHPGWVDTPGIETALPKFHSGIHSILRTPEQGADTIVWLASSIKAGLSTGKFWLDRRPHETVVFPGTAASQTEKQVLWQKLSRLTENI